MRKLAAALISVFLLASCTQKEKRIQVLFQTDMGDILVELFNETPLHRDNFIKQVERGAYDGILWHRVIDGFIIQTGDELSRNAQPGELLGEGIPEDALPENWVPAEFRVPQYYHRRGMLNAARQGDELNPEKKSSMTQFTIVTGKTYTDEELDRTQLRINEWTGGTVKLTPEMREVYKTEGGAAHLDGSYTVFGQVIKGMDVADRIVKVATDENDRPIEDVRIIKATVLE